MSDTHGFEGKLHVPKGDLLVHCGDIMPGKVWKGSAKEQLEDFAHWFKRLPFERKLIISGNHDDKSYFQKVIRDTLGDKVLLKEGDTTCLGLSIHSLPYSNSRGGFGYTPIPPGVDILLSHEPPWGILDESLFPVRDWSEAGKFARERGLERSAHIGSPSLWRQLERLGDEAPRLHVFGHIHEAHGSFRGAHEELGSELPTLFVNAAMANGGRAQWLEQGCMVMDVPVARAEPAVFVECSEKPPKQKFR